MSTLSDLITDKKQPRKMSASNPKLQIEWSSSSLRTFQECPRKYQYQVLEGWYSRSTPTTLGFGKFYHQALEIYDRALCSGKSELEASDMAGEYALTCGFDARDDNRRTRFTLTRSVVWYTEQYKNTQASMPIAMLDGKPAVEVYFVIELPIKSPSGEPYVVRGYLDNVVLYDDEPHVRERKTTVTTLGDNYFSRFSPDLQISIYALGAYITMANPAKGVLIDACQTAVNFSRFDRFFAFRHPSLLDETMDEITHYIKKAEMYADMDWWPRNESSCFLCQFKDICSKSAGMRETYLDADFVRESE